MRLFPILIGLTTLAACETPPSDVADAPEILIEMGEIETDTAGRCFTRDAPPTEVRIVEETVIVVPEVRDELGRITRTDHRHSRPAMARGSRRYARSFTHRFSSHRYSARCKRAALMLARSPAPMTKRQAWRCGTSSCHQGSTVRF